MRWQLIPRWWKKSLKELPATFNARAEVAEKPIFRDAFRRNRYLIPVTTNGTLQVRRNSRTTSRLETDRFWRLPVYGRSGETGQTTR